MAVKTHYNAVHNGYTYQETYDSITDTLYRGILLNDKEVTSASCRGVTEQCFVDYIPSSLDGYGSWVCKYWKDMDKSSLDLLNRKKSMDKYIATENWTHSSPTTNKWLYKFCLGKGDSRIENIKIQPSEKDKSQYTDCDKSYGTKCKFNVGSNRCSNKDVTGGLLQFSTCPYFQKKEVKKMADCIVDNDNKKEEGTNMEDTGNSLMKELVDEMKINNEINRKCLQGLKEIQEMIEKQKSHDVTDTMSKALPITWGKPWKTLVCNVNEQ